jgi:glyoxylase-like metal-dependent hydrolase (beta-lactamase superfamily II)
MKITILSHGPLLVNTYIVGDLNQDCYVIDPGYDEQSISKMIKKYHSGVKAILLTHGHYDHIGAVNELANMYKCKVYIHPFDFVMAKNPRLNYSFGTGRNYGIEVTVEDITNLNDENVEVIHTPGHSKGSICLYFKNDKVLFSGDTLFSDGVGRTDLYSSNINELNESLKKLMLLHDDVLVYPGHDEFTTIGSERNNLQL